MKMSSLNITQRTTLKQWKTISLLMGVIAQLFLAGDWYGFAAVIPFVTETLHLSPLQIGVVQGSFSITYALGMVFGPHGEVEFRHVHCTVVACWVLACSCYCSRKSRRMKRW